VLMRNIPSINITVSIFSAQALGRKPRLSPVHKLWPSVRRLFERLRSLLNLSHCKQIIT